MSKYLDEVFRRSGPLFQEERDPKGLPHPNVADHYMSIIHRILEVNHIRLFHYEEVIDKFKEEENKIKRMAWLRGRFKTNLLTNKYIVEDHDWYMGAVYNAK